MRRLLRCIAALILTAALGTAVKAAPLASSFIENRAEASGFDPVSGLHGRLSSNVVRLAVAAKEALLLEQDQQRAFPPGSEARFIHRLSNTGNAVTTYALTLRNTAGDDFDLANLRLVRDANGNGLADAGEAEIDSIALEPGASADLVVLGQVPADAGGSADLTLDAVGDTQRSTARNTDRVVIGRDAATRVVKSTLTQTPETGEEIRYGLLVTHHGDTALQPMALSVDGVAASYVLLADTLPPNTDFVAIAGQGVALHHLSGEADTVWHASTPADAGRVMPPPSASTPCPPATARAPLSLCACTPMPPATSPTPPACATPAAAPTPTPCARPCRYARHASSITPIRITSDPRVQPRWGKPFSSRSTRPLATVIRRARSAWW